MFKKRKKHFPSGSRQKKMGILFVLKKYFLGNQNRATGRMYPKIWSGNYAGFVTFLNPQVVSTNANQPMFQFQYMHQNKNKRAENVRWNWSQTF